MQVHYNKFRGIFMIVSGLVLIMLHLVVLSRGHGNPWLLIPCGVILVTGFLYLYRPYFELRENELVIFGLLGQVVKRYGFSSLADFRVRGRRVYIVKGDKNMRVRLTSWIALKPEWDRFMDRITGHDLTNELHNL